MKSAAFMGRIMATARDQIIETTCNLLEMQGYHATGLNQIVKESKSPKGSLYYYFPGGKEELAAEAVSHVGRIVLQRIQDNLAQVEDSAEAVRAFIRQIAINVERSGFRSGGPITTIAMETASTNVGLREVCYHIYNEWQGAFASKLEQGGMDAARARRIATLIIAAIEGAVILCRTSQSRVPMEMVSEEIYELVRLSP
ncbi:MAG: TetR/AcrR family transcriptional regulator [Anaerolineae bacterium]|nr:TetR/AcrR family transcriptional regulator [Anaerolineae bacterium]